MNYMHRFALFLVALAVVSLAATAEVMKASMRAGTSITTMRLLFT